MLRIKSTIYLTGQVNNNEQNFKFKTNQSICSFVILNLFILWNLLLFVIL